MKVYIDSVIAGFVTNKKGITTFSIKTGKISPDQLSMIGKEVSLNCELVLTVE